MSASDFNIEVLKNCCCSSFEEFNDKNCSPTHEQDDLTYFSRVTSNASVELFKTFASLDQTVGILSDFQLFIKAGKPIRAEQLQKVVDALNAQVKAGTRLTQELNRFAFFADVRLEEYKLASVLNNLHDLIKRFAVLKGGSLEIDYPDKNLKIKGDPFAIMHSVFLAYQALLTALEPEQSIRISTLDSGQTISVLVDGPLIKVSSAGCIAGECDLAFISCVMEKEKGRCEYYSDDSGTHFVLTIPK